MVTQELSPSVKFTLLIWIGRLMLWSEPWSEVDWPLGGPSGTPPVTLGGVSGPGGSGCSRVTAISITLVSARTTSANWRSHVHSTITYAAVAEALVTTASSVLARTRVSRSTPVATRMTGGRGVENWVATLPNIRACRPTTWPMIVSGTASTIWSTNGGVPWRASIILDPWPDTGEVPLSTLGRGVRSATCRCRTESNRSGLRSVTAA